MKSKLCWKVISMLLVIATLVTALPLTIFAAEASGESSADGGLFYRLNEQRSAVVDTAPFLA